MNEPVQRLALANQHLRRGDVRNLALYIMKLSDDAELCAGHVFLAKALIDDKTARLNMLSLLGIDHI